MQKNTGTIKKLMVLSRHFKNLGKVMFIDEKSLYIMNSTYRNPARLLSVLSQLQEKEAEQLTYQEIIDTVQKDIKNEKISEKTIAESFKRKVSEINRFDFVKIKNNSVSFGITIKNLSSQLENDIINSEELYGNAILMCLKQEQKLDKITTLIQEIDQYWHTVGGYREGISEKEMVYIYAFVKANGQQPIKTMVDKIIDLRLAHKQEKTLKNKPGSYKLWLTKKMKAEFEDSGLLKLNSLGDYIDTFIRALTLSNCFVINRNEDDKKQFMKMVQINSVFKDKLNFFIHHSYEDLKELANNNLLVKELYKVFNVKEAFSKTSSHFEDLINHHPEKLDVDINQYIKNNDTWFNYEKDSVFAFFKKHALHNLKEYKLFKKKIATKSDNNGNAYGGTTSGVADGCCVMKSIVINVEATLICKELSQESKEFTPVKQHLNNELLENNKTKGIAIIVTPYVTESLSKAILKHNHNAVSWNEGFIIALTTEQYIKLLNVCYNEESWLKIYDKFEKTNWLAFRYESNPFMKAMDLI